MIVYGVLNDAMTPKFVDDNSIQLATAAMWGNIGKTVTQIKTEGVPGRYVEGKSRYVWMPDGNGTPQLVDLRESLDESELDFKYGIFNEYCLYTRSNPEVPQIITHWNETTIWDSNYAVNKTTYILIHGWKSDGYCYLIQIIKDTLLATNDCNVIILDWRVSACSNYFSANYASSSIGEYLGRFISWLIATTNGSWDNIHLIGFSVGAHIAGFAGYTTNGLIARISGLDPAAPFWWNNPRCLNTSAAQYVEVIHTDGGRLSLFQPMGHVDFYVNGGKNPQPGCWLSPCSHRRSALFFAASLIKNLYGHKCVDIVQAEKSECSGKILSMGNSDVTKRGLGIYSVTTGSEWPFNEDVQS